jgi:hypothetical protein
MKKAVIITLITVFFLSILSSCKKYDKGPSLSLVSKKARLVNTWKVVLALSVDGHDYTEYYSNYTLEIKKDNTYVETWDGDTYVGTWAFDNDKEKVIFTRNGESESETFIITQLKSKYLNLKETNTKPLEFYYHPK